jgi:hypothetical protein
MRITARVLVGPETGRTDRAAAPAPARNPSLGD